MDVSDFIQNLAQKIAEMSGVKLNASLKSMIPKEIQIVQEKPGETKVILRTAEQTQNLDVVELKQFDPYFQKSNHETPCRVPGCPKKKRFIQEFESKRKSEMIKRDLFVCETHREKLVSGVLKYFRKQSVTGDVESLKKVDLTGYTSLIGVLEKAFMHLMKKSWKDANNHLLAEIFLNARNFLIITNALLNPDEDNTTTVLGLLLPVLRGVLEDTVITIDRLMVLSVSVPIILTAYGVMYEWIMIPRENPGAKVGTALAIMLVLFVYKAFEVQLSWETILFSALFVFSSALLFSGAYDWNLDPQLIEERRARLLERNQQLILELLQEMSAPLRQGLQLMLRVRGDLIGNLLLELTGQVNR